LMAFGGAEANVVAVATDEGGLQVEALEDLLAGGARPKFLYTIPEYQNPTGRTLALARRRELIEVCRRHGVLIFEDVAYRELAFDGMSLPSLWSLAPDLVVQAGTFSKSFFPGVRLGWAAGPAPVIAELAAAKLNTDQCAGALGQRLFEEYVRRGWIEEQLVASRSLYRRKCERMLAALERAMPEHARWTRPRGGFFSWLTLPDGSDTALLAARAADEGVGVVPGALFFADGRGGQNLRLSFSLVDEAQIDEGIERLASVL
jgi:2-aminoadipate transaminase